MINSLKLTIWEREFELPIVYDSLSDGVITLEQQKAIDNLECHLEWIESAKGLVEDYCKESLLEDDENKKKDNIFSYVKPERLFVTRGNPFPQVAIMCKYRYDPEHGLAVVFSFDGKKEVGSQNIVL